MQKVISFLKNIVFAYFWIGGLIATFRILSWLFWGIPKTLYVDASLIFTSFGGFVSFLIAAFFQLVLHPLLTLITWGFGVPGIVAGDVSIFKFLFPGFYDLVMYVGG